MCGFRWLITVAVVGVALGAGAQTAPTQATPQQIHAWLRGSDLRLVAWGAQFAATALDTDEIPQLIKLAEDYQAIPTLYDEQGSLVKRTAEERQRADAMDAVLDALIRLNATVPYDAIMAVFPEFPDQAMTLFALLPEPERSARAELIYSMRSRGDEPFERHSFERNRMMYVAAAILAMHPPPGFTATLLREATVTLQLEVTDDAPPEYGVGSACGDSLAVTPPQGWPEPSTYVLEEQWRAQGDSGVLLLVPGTPLITSRRSRALSTCYGLPAFSSVQRLMLARREAGIVSRSAWYGPRVLRYPGARLYPASVSAVVEKSRSEFRDLARTLSERTFLTEEEARTALPNFVVEIEDKRHDQTEPLPADFPLGERAVFRPFVQSSGIVRLAQ